MPVIQLELDSSGAVKSLQKFDKATDASAKNTQSAFSKMKGGYVAIAGVIGTVLGAAVTVFAAKALEAASSMVETQGVFDAAFEGMTDTAEAWATALGTDYNIAALHGKQYLNSLQLVFKGMGIATEEAGEMSFALVKVGTDLASAFDAKTVDVVRDIRSAMSGSTEAMDKYGVVVRQAEINQKALSLGLADTTKEITQGDKATATYALIMEKSATVAGTTAREMVGYRGQMNELEKTMTNLTVALGQKLLPIATQYLTMLNDWIEKTDAVNKVVNFSVEAIRALVNAWLGLEIVFKAMIVIIAATIEGFVAMLAPVKLLIDALIWLGYEGTNPIRDLEKITADFTASAIEGVGNTVKKIEDLNASFDKAKNKTKEVVVEAKKIGTEAAPEVQKAADAVENNLIPAEKSLENQIKAVTNAANASTGALHNQAAAAKVVNAAMSGQTPNNTWSSGQTPNDSWSEGQTPNDSWSNGLGTAYDPTYESGAFDPKEVFGNSIDTGDVFGGPTDVNEFGGGSINLYINQSMSRSDVVNITEEQKRLSGR